MAKYRFWKLMEASCYKIFFKLYLFQEYFYTIKLKLMARLVIIRRENSTAVVMKI